MQEQRLAEGDRRRPTTEPVVLPAEGERRAVAIRRRRLHLHRDGVVSSRLQEADADAARAVEQRSDGQGEARGVQQLLALLVRVDDPLPPLQVRERAAVPVMALVFLARAAGARRAGLRGAVALAGAGVRDAEAALAPGARLRGGGAGLPLVALPTRLQI